MQARRFVAMGMSLFLLLGIVSAVGAFEPITPTDEPEPVVTQATDYYIQAPKLFYLYNPPCAPILGLEQSESGAQSTPSTSGRDGTPASNEGEGMDSPVTQFVGRTAVYGAPLREMYDYTFDSFCNPPDDPDIISDIVADADYVYWISNQQDALVKISEDRLDWESTLPDVVYAHTAQSSELVLVGDNIYMLQTGFVTDGLYRVNKNTGAATQLLTAGQVGTNPNNLQTDGEYLYWRYWTGSQWDLRAYDLDVPGTETLANDVMSYYPVAGNRRLHRL
jgi:hypothetical protein